jgi:hypothetical protein
LDGSRPTIIERIDSTTMDGSFSGHTMRHYHHLMRENEVESVTLGGMMRKRSLEEVFRKRKGCSGYFVLPVSKERKKDSGIEVGDEGEREGEGVGGTEEEETKRVFCSDECGLSVARFFMLFGPSGGIPQKSKTLPTTKKPRTGPGLEVLDRKRRSDFGVDESTDCGVLKGLWERELCVRRRVRALEVRAERIRGAILRSHQPISLHAGGGSNVQNAAGNDNNNDAFAHSERMVCGFDRRIVSDWVVCSGRRWELFHESTRSTWNEEEVWNAELLDGMNDIVDEVSSISAADSEHVCLADVGCKTHYNWKKLKIFEVDVEIAAEVFIHTYFFTRNLFTFYFD